MNNFKMSEARKNTTNQFMVSSETKSGHLRLKSSNLEPRKASLGFRYRLIRVNLLKTTPNTAIIKRLLTILIRS